MRLRRYVGAWETVDISRRQRQFRFSSAVSTKFRHGNRPEAAHEATLPRSSRSPPASTSLTRMAKLGETYGDGDVQLTRMKPS
ncbi:hypothetical protein PIB30_038526 [Stylosanthes scabra]|uniref:Uncharacterized protein n=1 Tax=Stylosanthes scabra TaxID=79078 RepID=A0ABU6VDK7_9FABA|nr:hypothetical protein [Stylosanthes scabra]